MAHFAEIHPTNKMVLRVVVIDDDFQIQGEEYCAEGWGGVWKQTSYNTRGGVYYDPETGEPAEDQSKALRKNFAGPGMIYDEDLDAFYWPNVPVDTPSWVFDEETCTWVAPVPKPETGGPYSWDEENTQWVPFSESVE